MRAATILVVVAAVAAAWYFSRGSSLPQRGPDRLPAAPPAPPAMNPKNFAPPQVNYAVGAMSPPLQYAQAGAQFTGDVLSLARVTGLFGSDDD